MKIQYTIENIENGVLLHFDGYNSLHDMGKQPPKYFQSNGAAINAIIRELEVLRNES